MQTSLNLSLQPTETPYQETMKQLLSQHFESSPLTKLEVIYKALKFTIASEVEQYWTGREDPKSKPCTTIDMDNLQGICIYLVKQLQQPQLLIDCFILNEFIT